MTSQTLDRSQCRERRRSRSRSTARGEAHSVSPSLAPAAAAADPKPAMASEDTRRRPSTLRGDYGNVALLLLLYTLQGIPMGLASVVPIYMQRYGHSFAAKGTFSFASWPFSLKLLWAPIVDSVYWRRLGRRKSWILPIQILLGIVMLFLSTSLDASFADLPPPSPAANSTSTSTSTPSIGSSTPSAGSGPDLYRLTGLFFCVYLLIATQDIAVDGWALTMLRPENVGYASFANSVGQTLGYLISYACVLALGDPSICNWLFRSAENASPEPIITLGGFMRLWAWLTLAITLGVGVGKSERPPDPSEHVDVLDDEEPDENPSPLVADGSRGKLSAAATAPAALSAAAAAAARARDFVADSEVDADAERGSASASPIAAPVPKERTPWWFVKATYRTILRVLKTPLVQSLSVVLLTARFGFAAVDHGSDMRMLSDGVHKSFFLTLNLIGIPLELMSNTIVSRWTANAGAWDVFRRGAVLRLGLGTVFITLIKLLPMMRLDEPDAPVSTPFLVLIGVNFVALRIVSSAMFLAQITFFARVSDAAIGGTYMTLLNTIANLGAMMPGPIALFSIELFDSRTCRVASVQDLSGTASSHFAPTPPAILGATCANEAGRTRCRALGGSCHIDTDGYLIVGLLSTVAGALWLYFMRSRMDALDASEPCDWLVKRQESKAAAERRRTEDDPSTHVQRVLSRAHPSEVTLNPTVEQGGAMM